MRIFFAVYILFSLVTFKVCSQKVFFEQDNWRNVVKLAKEKNQMIIIYLFSENCKNCKNTFNDVFSDSTILSHYSKENILFKVNVDKKIGKSLVNKYFVKQNPSVLLVLPNGNLFREFSSSTVEIPKEIIIEYIDEGKKEFDVFYSYYQDFKNPILIKKYLEQRIGYGSQWKNEEIIESYLKKISEKEKETNETLNLILNAGFFINGEVINTLYKHLEIAKKQQNLIKQYLIKLQIFERIVETVNKGTFESKVNLKRAFEITEHINKITQNFNIYDKQMLELIYHANAKNKTKFMKYSKQYFSENKFSFNKQYLDSKDSLFKKLTFANTLFDSSDNKNQKEIIQEISNFNKNNQASKLSIISKAIFFQQLQPRNIDFGIECAKIAAELSPNASRYAILGLLYNKNEKYKLAYEYLTKALELEADHKEKIDSDVAKQAISTFLNIQKRIPIN